MEEFGQKKTHTKDGQELSQLFIGEDGKLSVFLNDEETEVVGYHSNVFGDSFLCKTK